MTLLLRVCLVYVFLSYVVRLVTRKYSNFDVYCHGFDQNQNAAVEDIYHLHPRYHYHNTWYYIKLWLSCAE